MTSPTTHPSQASPTSPLAALSALGTSVWIDSIRRAMLETGELKRLIDEDCVVGVTSNPSIFEKAILGSPDYDERLRELSSDGCPVKDIYWTLALEDVRDAADVLRPVYDASDGHDGYVSLEVAPELAHDTEGTIAAAADLWRRLDRPNVMIKIPGTPEGVEAIRRSVAAGININITLLFSVDAYLRVADAYLAGLEERVGRGEPIDRVASVASFFVSRVDSAIDPRLMALGRDDLLGRAAVANAKVAYGHFTRGLTDPRFVALREHGARPQRLLWASTSTKDPRYPDTKYVTELAGPQVVNTMPMATLQAFQDHGVVGDELTDSEHEARQLIEDIEAAGISLAEVTEQLLVDGIAAFAEALDKLLAGIERRREAVVSGQPPDLEARLTEQDAEAIGERVRWAQRERVALRIWRTDHTLWKPSPEEISNRLGWLTIAEQMRERLCDLTSFTTDLRQAGFTDCVLLGMGGSSLAPLVLRRSFGSAPGFLDLHVLDSTDPDAVAALAERLTLERTLFLVSSKSGGTLEPRALYSYFRGLIDDGSHFVAITDPDTALADQAEREGFRRTFLNDPDIGGRYSALSYFGLLPAALIGVNVWALLDSAEVAMHSSMPELACDQNRALWLGLAIGTLAQRGRDKLTFVVSEPLSSLGLWLEQLVAESTGKEGKGIVPIADEPLGEPAAYGADRVFVHLRNAKQADEEVDRRLAALADAGHPVISIPFDEAADLGAQFFTWELAVATAGAVLAINPFDQPNVQEAKDLVIETIEAYRRDGRLPEEEVIATQDDLRVLGPTRNGGPTTVAQVLAELLDEAGPGSYLATLAYIAPSARADRALTRLRLSVRDARAVATTVGYGPRYLHSTGQLHKGGPPSGRFLQITHDGRGDVEVPGAGYDFATLIRAQAIGDLRALRSRDLPAVHVHLSGDVERALEQLAQLVAEVAEGDRGESAGTDAPARAGEGDGTGRA